MTGKQRPYNVHIKWQKLKKNPKNIYNWDLTLPLNYLQKLSAELDEIRLAYEYSTILH